MRGLAMSTTSIRPPAACDNRNRLIAEARVGQHPYSLTYAYDIAGNRTVKVDVLNSLTTTYTYDGVRKGVKAEKVSGRISALKQIILTPCLLPRHLRNPHRRHRPGHGLYPPEQIPVDRPLPGRRQARLHPGPVRQPGNLHIHHRRSRLRQARIRQRRPHGLQETWYTDPEDRDETRPPSSSGYRRTSQNVLTHDSTTVLAFGFPGARSGLGDGVLLLDTSWASYAGVGSLGQIELDV